MILTEYDEMATMDAIREEGREVGREEGREAGREEGSIGARMEAARKMLADKLSDALICKYLSISMEQLAKVKAGQN